MSFRFQFDLIKNNLELFSGYGLMRIIRRYKFQDGRQNEPIQHKADEYDIAGLQRRVVGSDNG